MAPNRAYLDYAQMALRKDAELGVAFLVHGTGKVDCSGRLPFHLLDAMAAPSPDALLFRHPADP